MNEFVYLFLCLPTTYLVKFRLHLRNEYIQENLKGAGGREEVDRRIKEEFETILVMNEQENEAQALKRLLYVL